MDDLAEVRLIGAPSSEDVERVHRMMEPEEIWRAFGFSCCPPAEDWCPQIERGASAAFFLEHPAGGILGFLLSGLSRFYDWG